MNIERENANLMRPSTNNIRRSEQRTHPGRGRYLNNQPTNVRRRRRRRRKLNPRFVILMAVLLAMLIGIALGIRSCSKPSIVGRWNLDGTTVYEFYKDGKGALVLMTMKFDFLYEIDENKLSIDFIDDGALDAVYTFELKDDMLFWTGGHGDSKNTYALQREG